MHNSNEAEKLKAMGVPRDDAQRVADLMQARGLDFGKLFKLIMAILQAVGDSGILEKSADAPQTLPR